MRIVLDEQIRLSLLSDKHVTVYNLPLLYRSSQGSLSIQRLRHVLQQITQKHAILRTSVHFNPVSSSLEQYIHPNNEPYGFTFCISYIENDTEKDLVQKIFTEELTNQTYFDLTQARVGRCHILRHRLSAIDNDEDVLSINDWIIFNFHHAVFDGESEQIFLNELQALYHCNQPHPTSDEETALQYIDCESI